jgi:hypothetical protein
MATMKTAATSGASEAAETAREVGSEFEQLDQRVRGFVKERPILALLSAIAAGYVVGRVLRRHG